MRDKEKRKEYGKKYRAEHKDIIATYQRDYRINNEEEYKKKAREYYERTREEIYKPYYRKNCEEKRKKQKDKRDKRRAIVYEYYGKKCICCGEKNIKFLTIDHVNNDGHIERKNGISTTDAVCRKIIKDGFPDTYRILCYNCNLGRARNGGLCPHKESINEFK